MIGLFFCAGFLFCSISSGVAACSFVGKPFFHGGKMPVSIIGLRQAEGSDRQCAQTLDFISRIFGNRLKKFRVLTSDDLMPEFKTNEDLSHSCASVRSAA